MGTFCGSRFNGSGRGDRNQRIPTFLILFRSIPLQWGPVVVTGISGSQLSRYCSVRSALQWGPVVVTGIRGGVHRCLRPDLTASMGSGRGDRNQVGPNNCYVTSAVVLQWGPVVVTGIRLRSVSIAS